MPHSRIRHLQSAFRKQGKFWPVIGLLGLRQSGKTTFLRDQAGLSNYYTLDDEEVQDDLALSAKNFLRKVGAPVVIDEAQKSPQLFDAVKLMVDQKRVPGQYYLTGSSQFSARLGIRESLTGRIGLLRLYPFTMAEAHQKDLQPDHLKPLHKNKIRFKVQQALERLTLGGLPVPQFARDTEIRSKYFASWLETSIYRDAARAYGQGYDPDVAWSILRQLGGVLKQGEYPTLKHFKQDSRVLRRYLAAFEDIFLLWKIPCHEQGVGQDVWTVSDGGLATSIMGSGVGEGATLSLARIFVLNEILAGNEYAETPLRPLYYKSARGSPVDLVWGDSLLKISHLPRSQSKYDERALEGAMKTTGIRNGILVTPRDEVVLTSNGISRVPWTFWS